MSSRDENQPRRVPGPWSRATSAALLLGLVHAVVDSASGFLVFADVGSGRYDRPTVVFLVVLYNVLAFAGQAPLGWLADRLGAYRAAASLGVVLGAAALLLAPWDARAGVVLVGLGNALFHVGAGAHVLRCSGERATEAGVFVGPGAVGLFVGIWAGGAGLPLRWPVAALLACSVPLLLHLLRAPEPAPPAPRRLRAGAGTVAFVCALCLLGSIGLRAMVGGAVAGVFRGVSLEVMLLLALAACAGKMVGGFVSDRLGWAAVSLAALLVSAPLVSALVIHPEAAVAGMLLFQMTMAVTLKAVHHLMPGRPGLAFGLPCVALVGGSLPDLLGLHLLENWHRTLGSVLVSAALVALGLFLLARAGASSGPGGRPEPPRRPA